MTTNKYHKKNKDTSTLIVTILDRSGSMASIKTDMEGGLNQFIKEQAAEPGECHLFLAQFDTKYEVVADYVDIHECPTFTLSPRGNTALLDAIGQTLTSVGEKLDSMSKADRPGHVIVSIITDGMENASKEWTHSRVMTLIKKYTDERDWQFTYLGANQDAIAVGYTIGVNAASSFQYDSGFRGVAAAFGSLSAVHTSLRGGTSETISYTDAEREEAIQK